MLFGIDFLGFCEEEFFCLIIIIDLVLVLNRVLVFCFIFEGLLVNGGYIKFVVFCLILFEGFILEF